MEDYRNQFIAILAGYEREMKQFLSTNPGLPSRFPIHITFPDYSVNSLLEIARRTASYHQYTLTMEAEVKLRRHLQEMFVYSRNRELTKQSDFSNARWVRNTIEKAIRMHAARLFERPQIRREDLEYLQSEDFCWEVT